MDVFTEFQSREKDFQDKTQSYIFQLYSIIFIGVESLKPRDLCTLISPSYCLVSSNSYGLYKTLYHFFLTSALSSTPTPILAIKMNLML